MANEEFTKNIQTAKDIIQEILMLEDYYSQENIKDKDVIEKASASLIQQLFLINNSFENSINDIQFKKETDMKKKNIKEIEKESKKSEIKRVEALGKEVFLKKIDKDAFLREVKLEKELLGKIKRIKGKPEEQKIIQRKEFEIEPSSFWFRISNQLFRDLSAKLSKTTMFSSIEKDLKKANLYYRVISYISLTIFLTLLSLIFASGFSFFLGIENLLRNFLLMMLIPITVLITMLLYPKQKAESLRKKIENELPFAVSNMAAIASSNLEPTKIFLIMANSEEFQAFSKEAKKVVNQVNFYGADMSIALRNVAKNTASQKLTDLFNGISSNITTGGSLSVYLNEKAKDYLFEYKLAREKYANTIGIYSDVYTALLIAAPLLFMLLLVVISIIGTTIAGMSLQNLSIIGTISIAILNVLFLIFLSFAQPEL